MRSLKPVFPHVLLIAPGEITVLLLEAWGLLWSHLCDAVFGLENLKGVTEWQLMARAQYPHSSCSGLNRVPQNSCAPGTSACDLIGNRLFVSQDFIILDLGWALNPMVCACEKIRRCRDIGNEAMWRQRRRVECVATSQGMSDILPTKLGKRILP